MAYHNILAKVDKALVAYLISAGAGTEQDVFPSKNAATNDVMPYTAVMAESYAEAQEYSSAFIVKATVEVHTNCAPERNEDTESMALDSDARVQATGDALMTQNDMGDGYGLGEEITTASNVSDFTCISARLIGGEQGRDEKQGEWIDIFNLELVCTPSDVG